MIINLIIIIVLIIYFILIYTNILQEYNYLFY